MEKQIFFLKQNQKSNIIWVKFYIKTERITFSTGIEVTPINFDPISCRVRAAEKFAKDKNLLLVNIESRVNDVFVKFKLRDRDITKESFLKEYARPSDYNNFFVYVENYIKRTRVTIEDSTVKVHRAAMKNLQTYKCDLTFDEITEDFLQNYFHYLRKVEGLGDSTAYKKLSILKKYVRAAVREGYMDIDPFLNFRIRKIKSTSFVYLDENELSQLIAYYHGKEITDHEHNILRFFLYMCFSSQHVTDAKNTKIEDIFDNALHYYRVKLRNSKPELITIPLSVPLKEIIEDVKGKRTRGHLFTNLPSDQKINMHLKSISKNAGLDKPITCKSGRHTFATIFLARTQQLTALKELLGHTSLEETLKYAHVLDVSKQEGMTCFDKFG